MPESQQIQRDGNLTVLPPMQPAPPPMSVSFDIAAAIKSPFFWLVAGAAVTWYLMRKQK